MQPERASAFEQIGTPQELYHDPASAFVAGFVGDSNRWRGRAAEVKGKQVRVETETGFAVVGDSAGNQPVAQGSTVDMFVRPEFITVSRDLSSAPAAGDGVNSLSGKVDSLLFNGANSRILVRTERDELIEAGFPVMTFEGNMGDEREFDLGRTRTRIDTFMETLGRKRSGGGIEAPHESHRTRACT